LGQNQNGPSISPQDYISYQPSFRLTSVLSQTVDNAGNLTISSVDTNNPAKTSYGSPQYITIKLVPTTTPPSNHAPTIQSVENISNTCSANADTCQVKVTWNNPQDYDNEYLYYTAPLNSKEPVPAKDEQGKWIKYDVSSDKEAGTYSYTITGLKAGKKYGVYIHAKLKKQQ